MTPLIRARIDGAALQFNLLKIRSLAPAARIMAVVKANAYGHGLVNVAHSLQAADALAVARLEEAVALRAAAITQRIVLLEGVNDAEQLQTAAQLGLDLVVHDASHLPLLATWRGPQRFSLWVKIDSGMNRLGFRAEEFAQVWSRLQSLAPAPLELRLLTHLANADTPEDGAVSLQLQRFLPLVPRGIEASVANSAAILRLPATHADWVRPGLALYGVSPLAGLHGRQLGLRPAMTLETTVIALRQVAQGESVGYGGAWRATRTTRLAILAAGYGDGLLRSLPSGAPVLIHDQRVPLVGRVSMDMIAVDVTALAHCQVGDRAELWGARLPVEELAVAAGTIPYELLCGVSQRVPLESSG